MTDIEAGSRGINEELNDREWEGFHPEVRAFVLYDFLTAIDLQAVDPEFFFVNEYGIKTARTQADIDRLQAKRDEMVERYRGEHRMLPRLEINNRVARLLPQSPSEMASKFMAFIEERNKANNR
jgi:hypothetical protein